MRDRSAHSSGSLPRVPVAIHAVSLALVLGVLASHLYFGATGLCATSPLSGQTVVLVVTLTVLVVFDLWIGRARRITGLAGALWLGVQFAVIEAVAVMDCAGFSKFLYLLGPLWAFGLFGRSASIGIGVAYFGVLTLHQSQQDALWYGNREYVTVLLIFAVGLVFVVTMADALQHQAADRVRAEALLGALERSHEQLRESLARVRDLAATDERNRLARDIHDGLGHHLTAITIQLGKARAFRQRDAEEAYRAIDSADQAAREALADVRESVRSLRAGADTFSLEVSVARLVTGAARTGLKIEHRFEGDETGYAQDARLALYRVAQEGLTNVYRHAQSAKVYLAIMLGPEWGAITIRDEGRGFDAAALAATEPTAHFGLIGLRERLAELGGTLDVRSAPGAGTEISAAVPRIGQSRINPNGIAERGGP